MKMVMADAVVPFQRDEDHKIHEDQKEDYEFLVIFVHFVIFVAAAVGPSQIDESPRGRCRGPGSAGG